MAGSAPSSCFSCLLALLALTSSCGGGCNDKSSQQVAKADGGKSSDGAPADALQFSRDGRLYTQQLADIDEEIGKTEARAESQPKSWLVLEKVAGLHLARARLSGSYDDYAAAEDALKRAFERAPEGSGPLLTRAALNFSLHRLDRMDADIDIVAGRAVLDDPTRARVEGLRGALAFERGQYDLAKQHLDAALALDRTATGIDRLALWHWRRGEFDQAETLYREAETMMGDEALESRAWTHLQLGLMDLDRGRHQEAFEHYRDGARILGGWWLIEEHVAEIAALLGHREQSLRLYTEIIAATGKGEFM
ncbi:MAG: tetratricopeptide repeat protein, partial [Myxococcales bacterium]|nr:tetratricopeptide repeat protein [Myxococcales bacterium]